MSYTSMTIIRVAKLAIRMYPDTGEIEVSVQVPIFVGEEGALGGHADIRTEVFLDLKPYEKETPIEFDFAICKDK